MAGLETSVLGWEEFDREHCARQEPVSRCVPDVFDRKHEIVGTSSKLRELLELIERVAPTSSTVLIEGESGTGKELVARALHNNSPRWDQPLVAINCAALTESLLESELFGHEKGAFTGAVARKKGKIEMAEGGTLFLDEISELAPAMQAKLLRALQEREFDPVGGTRSVKVNVRVIAATNRHLCEEVQAGKFRSDLFYRLNVVTLTTPPLRERREDIPLLAANFIAKVCEKYRIPVKTLTSEILTLLMQYDWPGNVRELENAIERAVVLGTSEAIRAEDLPVAVLEPAHAESADAGFQGAVKESKKQLVLQALEKADGHYVGAAKILGLHSNSLLRLIRTLGLRSIGGVPGPGQVGRQPA
jgi:two-component system, NtrC family, response regulator HydG